MNQNIINLIFGISIIFILYKVINFKEKMNNDDIMPLIKTIYKADIESIRNLSKISQNLIKNGELILPGGLQILGDLEVDGTSNLNKNINIMNDATFKGNTTFDKNVDIHGDLTTSGITKLNGNVNIDKNAKTTINGEIEMNNSLTVKNSNIRADNMVLNGQGLYINNNRVNL